MKKFTLIELLVVVSILGILMSMLLPSLARAKKKAHLVTCTNNLKQISTALTMFHDDMEYLPPSYTWNVGGGYTTWEGKIKDYMGNVAAGMDCPGTKRKITGFSWTDYGYNDWLNENHFAVGNLRGMKLINVTKPNDTAMVVDGYYRFVRGDNWQSWFHSRPRHFDKVNIMWGDSSISQLSQTDLNDNDDYNSQMYPWW